MSRKKLATTKNGYQTMMWTYLNRRENLKQRSGETDTSFNSRKYKLTIKIHTFKNAITRIEKKWDFMWNLHRRTIEFNQVDVRKLKPQLRYTEKINARYCFYKYCIENGIRGHWVSQWFGFKDKSTPSRGRRIFTRSFITNPEHKKMYHDFISFIKSD